MTDSVAGTGSLFGWNVESSDRVYSSGWRVIDGLFIRVWEGWYGQL